VSEAAPTAPSAGVKPPREPTQRKLKPGEIRYLVLEGGGGKGFAFLGAISVLEKFDVIKNCDGFGGASAGAITALLLSMGYTGGELGAFMHDTDFTRFFDLPVPRKIPTVYAQYAVRENSPAEQQFLEEHQAQGFMELMGVLGAAAQGLSALNPFSPRASEFGRKVNEVLFQISATLMRGDAPFAQLARFWPHYLAYLPADMGLFSGEAAREVIGALIVDRVKKKTKRPLTISVKSLDFKNHLSIFQKKLLVTGTNLSTGKTQIFSAEQTPNFPVADAVRISMGLPWIYKPYVITSGGEGYPAPGVYVDGGVWNNLPYREFDSEPAPPKKSASAAAAGGSAPKRRTLGLRLEVDSVAKVDSIGALTVQMLQHGLMGSGESQILDKYVDQLIVLDTCGLDLINFKPDPDKLDAVVRRAKREVWKYFDMEARIPPEDRNPEDEEAADGRRYRGEPCK
jgi:predicted acylesterase/phospholipase RssA